MKKPIADVQQMVLIGYCPGLPFSPSVRMSYHSYHVEMFQNIHESLPLHIFVPYRSF